MEVMSVAETDGARSDAPFDLDRLHPEERQLWEEYFTGPGNDGPVVRVWAFGYACMLELWGPPQVVSEYLAGHDPDNLVGQYLENVRRARREGRL
jgi:hypothetical protein